MITCGSQLVCSVAAVRRMLGIASSVRVRIVEFWRVVWVWIEGKRPTFMSKRKFLEHFWEWRKQQAKQLTVTEWLLQPGTYTATNPYKESRYTVECRADGVFCTCEDFSNQLQFWGKGCCKHGYAVLARLGFDSLKAYLERGKGNV